MSSSDIFLKNLKYLEQNKIYASTGKEEWENLWSSTEPTAEKINQDPKLILNNLFKNNIGEDLINIVKRWGANAIGMVGYTDSGELVTIDEDIFHEIIYSLQNDESKKNTNDTDSLLKINKDGYKERGLPPIPFNMLKLIDRLGEKALYKKLKNPNGTANDIVITPKLYNVAQQAVIFLKNQYGDLASAEKAQYANQETRMSSTKDFYKKLAEEGYDEMRIPMEEAEEELREPEFSNVNPDSSSYFDQFISDPNADTFKQLLASVSSNLEEGDTFGRNETSELMELARNAGADWITEENINFLYELFSV